MTLNADMTAGNITACVVQVNANDLRVTSEFKFWERRCKTTMQFVLLLYVPFFLSSFPEKKIIFNFYFIPNFCIRPTITDMDRKPLEFWGSALRYVLAASCHIL